jgi:predicted nucleotidyltransferase
MATRFEEILRVLTEGHVEFILVGGVAATVHGSVRLTTDIDVVYARNEENLRRIATCLSPLEPYLRGVPAGLPFRLDSPTLRAGLNFTLVTSLGDLDLLGEVTGGGTYDDLLPQSVTVTVFGSRCRCVTRDTLIRIKRAAGRVKDLEAIAELEAIRDRSR